MKLFYCDTPESLVQSIQCTIEYLSNMHCRVGCFEKHPTQHNKTRQTNPDFTPQNQLNATFPLSLGGLEGSALEFAVFRPSGKLDRNHRNIQ